MVHFSRNVHKTKKQLKVSIVVKKKKNKVNYGSEDTCNCHCSGVSDRKRWCTILWTSPTWPCHIQESKLTTFILTSGSIFRSNKCKWAHCVFFHSSCCISQLSIKIKFTLCLFLCFSLRDQNSMNFFSLSLSMLSMLATKLRNLPNWK